MDSLTDLLWHDGRFLGITWTAWKIIGWTGNALFFCRLFVQWYATEKRRQVVVPAAFWWFSLVGSFLLLLYGLHRRDSVFIFAYLFTWIPYIRNLVIHYRFANHRQQCASCHAYLPVNANYCPVCGVSAKTSAPALKK